MPLLTPLINTGTDRNLVYILLKHYFTVILIGIYLQIDTHILY